MLVVVHRNFNKIGLDSEYAEYVSFSEILMVLVIQQTARISFLRV
jgi:hypothetical protein